MTDKKLWFLGLFTDKELSNKAEVIRMAAGQGRGSVYNLLRQLSIEVTEQHRVLKREQAAMPPLRSVRDLEPGWWLVRWRDPYNDSSNAPWEDWHIMQVGGTAPMLRACLLMPPAFLPMPPVNIDNLLGRPDADERVQVAGPIRPPDADT